MPKQTQVPDEVAVLAQMPMGTWRQILTLMSKAPVPFEESAVAIGQVGNVIKAAEQDYIAKQQSAAAPQPDKPAAPQKPAAAKPQGTAKPRGKAKAKRPATPKSGKRPAKAQVNA